MQRPMVVVPPAQVCEERGLTREMVYVLGRMGSADKARERGAGGGGGAVGPARRRAPDLQRQASGTMCRAFLQALRPCPQLLIAGAAADCGRPAGCGAGGRVCAAAGVHMGKVYSSWLLNC